MSRRFSLNLATILTADLSRKLHAASAAGFPAVGLLFSDLVRGGETALAELQASGLAVSELVELSGWAAPDRAARATVLTQAARAFELAAHLKSPVVVAAAPPGEVETVTVAQCFGELCHLAARHGVRVGLECDGAAEQLKDIAAIWDVVDTSGAENGGLVIDTFHFYRGGSTVEMLEAIPGKRIFLVQVADSMEVAPYNHEDRRRIYPGTGAIIFEPLLAALSEKSYDGYYSLELYNEDYWRADPLLVAREGMRAMRRL
jgi:2-keto-myo-inositol isomerase